MAGKGYAEEVVDFALVPVCRLPDPLYRRKDRVVARAVAMRRGRTTDALTRFDGDLSGFEVPDPTAGSVLSPTALEAWVRCPHAYFVARLLGAVKAADLDQVLARARAEGA